MSVITKSSYFVVLVTLICGALSPLAVAFSEVPNQDSPEVLSLVVIKVTGDEFIMIKNNSPAEIDDLSRFSLKAFNNFNPLVSNVSVTTQNLPAVSLGQGEMLLLSSLIRPTCGASLAGKLSLSLVDSSGRIEIIQSAANGAATSANVIDSVSWSSGLSGDIKSMPSNTKAPLAVYYRIASNGIFGWQLADIDSDDSCQFNVTLADSTDSSQVSLIPDPAMKPAEITIGLINDSNTVLEEDEIITMPVQITELLPNPLGSGNDTTDEYIELYNPNDSEFDLSGYQLQTGSSRLYNFTFKADTTLPAKSYKAFTSSVTGLTLSNTLGQARLLTPAGESVSATDVYRTAKDGLSWSLVEGVWKWSETATPNHANILVSPKLAVKRAPVTNNSLAKKNSREPTAKKPKTVKAAKPAKPKKIKTEKTTKYSAQPDTKTLMERPIQTKLVATVGSVAVLYGVYEYRSSLANGIYNLRRKLSFGRENRS